MKTTPKMDELVERVLADMEKGVPPWREPWFHTGMRNWETERPYSGINVMSLAYDMSKKGLTHGQFLTFKQAQKAGGRVKAGSHGSPVFFFKTLFVKDKEKENVEKKIPIMATYILFGVDQVEGIQPKPDGSRELTPNALGDKIIKGCGATITENSASIFAPARYIPALDRVDVPRRNLWKSDEQYYSTMFHELTHWTAPEKRVNRVFKYQGEGRAFEELVAELGGAFLSCFVGFEYETQHSAYLASWVSMLKNHKDALYMAASKAQKAVDFILQSSGVVSAPKVDAVAA